MMRRYSIQKVLDGYPVMVEDQFGLWVLQADVAIVQEQLTQAKRLLRETIRVWSYCYDCARHGRQRPCKRCDLVDEIELKFLADGGG